MLLQPVVFQSLQDKDQKMKTCNYYKFLISNGLLMFYFFLQLIFGQSLQTLGELKAWVWLKVGQSSWGARSNVAIRNHHQLLLNLAVLVMGLKFLYLIGVDIE